ncbi:MAG: aldehyde dehydrogenase family protein [Candidatus Puniceispirillaceae bacterium]
MGQNFIAGEWRNGVAEIANINPSDTSDIIGHFAQASRTDLEDAIQAARDASVIWAQSGLETRYNALMAIGTELMARSEELGRLLSREEGKPLAEGKGEVYRAGQFFTYYAAETLRQLGENADSVRPNIEIDVRREPVGVVAIISPWNFPTATAVWKIAPALAFGNAVIWKPANLVPASAVALTEIIARQELPKGLFNLVMGSGAEIGDALASHAGIDALTFTGSLDVGRQIAAAAAPNLTKLQMEMGSKNPLVIMDDCDMDLAVACASGGAFGGTGQKCTASSRLIIDDKIYDEFAEKLVQAAQALRVGHALEENTMMGPVVSEAQLASNQHYLDVARQEGGEILWGGDVLTQPTQGHYMAPAVIAGLPNSAQVNREEMFGPMTCLIKASGYEEALHLANDTQFGLTAGIMTSSLARANHFRRHAKTGVVMVNLPTAGTDYHVPFGGRGASSHGVREQGRAAVEFYTTVKTAYVGLPAGMPD